MAAAAAASANKCQEVKKLLTEVFLPGTTENSQFQHLHRLICDWLYKSGGDMSAENVFLTFLRLSDEVFAEIPAKELKKAASLEGKAAFLQAFQRFSDLMINSFIPLTKGSFMNFRSRYPREAYFTYEKLEAELYVAYKRSILAEFGILEETEFEENLTDYPANLSGILRFFKNSPFFKL